MREWEKATWAAGQSEAEVIRRVGRAVAEHALRLTHDGDSILILAGKGHNGDDARGAREHLSGREVAILNATEPRAALAEFTQKVRDRENLRPPQLIIDGLFGIGLDRPLDDPWRQFIAAVNETRIPILAVDVPSGLDGNTGQPQGAALKAAVTLTVGAPKKGLLEPAAWPYVGRLEVATEVGLAPQPIESELQWTLPEDFAGFPPPRSVAGNKGDFGHLAIIAGSLGYHGAAVLASRSAQRARPGLITLFVPESVYTPIASQLQAVMVQPWKTDIDLAGRFSAVLIGPGLAAPELPDAIKSRTQQLWKDLAIPVIVDASALDWLPSDSPPESAVRVITPHPGEAARLLKTTAARVQADRLRALRELSERCGGAWVVLKGHQTLVGRSADRVFVNSSGNPGLAQGGSGDVLGGYLAGLLAQPAHASNPLQAIRFAVWQHGAAADGLQSSRPNWVVENLVRALGAVQPPAW